MSMTKWRPSKREQIRGVNATHRFYAASSDKPGAMEHADALCRPEPKVRGPREDHADLEKHVLRAVGELLAVHPKVLFAVRQNSGAASYEAASGKWAPIWFYQIVTRQDVTISDYWGIMRDGRMMALECKRPSWRKPSNDRELRQFAFLMLIRNVGGIGEFVTSADQANALLA